MGNTLSSSELSNQKNINNSEFELESESFVNETNPATGENNAILENSYLPVNNDDTLLQRKRKHTKNSSDNIKNKILIYFLNFVVILINLIVKETLEKDYDSLTMEFYEFNSKFKKKNSSNKQLQLLKNCSISSFLLNDKNINNRNSPSHNKNAFNLIIDKNSKIKNILDKSLFEFFYFFHHKNNQIDLSKYCIGKIIDISCLHCFYEDVLKNKYKDEEEYINKMEKSIKKFFLKNPFFIKKNN